MRPALRIVLVNLLLALCALAERPHELPLRPAPPRFDCALSTREADERAMFRLDPHVVRTCVKRRDTRASFALAR